MILCDFAQASEGKLNILGGGWSIRGENTPMSIAIKIEVPWTESNRQHKWQLALHDADGQPVEVETPVGPQPVRFSAPFELGRPPGLPEGTPLDLPIAVNLGSIPLPPAARFEWRLEVDDVSQPAWHLSFLTRDSPQAFPSPQAD